MFCPACGVKMTGEFAFCPNCGQPSSGVQKQTGSSPSKGLVAASYGCAMVIPFIGFIMGIYLMYKERVVHGLAVIILSMIMMCGFWLQFFN
jgi:uncharacterized membrane protein YvbJ